MADDTELIICDQQSNRVPRSNRSRVSASIAVLVITAGLIGCGSSSSATDDIELPERCQVAVVVDNDDIEECLKFLQRENRFLEDNNNELRTDVEELRGELASAERLLADVEYALSELELLCYEIGRC